MAIREATLDDLGRCVEMGQAFLHSSQYLDWLVDNPAQMRAMCTQLIADPNGLVLVAESGGALVAMIGCLIFPHPLSGDRTAGELFFWCEPNHRGRGLWLLRRAEAWAARQGVRMMQMIQPAATPTVGTLYARLGYTPIEQAWARWL